MKTIHRWFRKVHNPGVERSSTRRKSLPLVESLEGRVVLYSATGNAWPNPALITVSFMPDGTDLGGVSSNMFAAFNGNAALINRWQNQVLQGLQLWAQQTNINFSVVPDDGAPEGTGAFQQGDPNHGDIRIGGYNFGNSALATTYQPPPINSTSISGDIILNTGQPFNIGMTYDLMTVIAHEAGHTLGLDHSTVASNVEMYPTYTAKKNLAADDVNGIRSIYSAGAPRSGDVYGTTNSTKTTATDLNSVINGAMSTVIPNLDITTVGSSDWYKLTVPAGTNGTVKVMVQSLGLSLLAPRVTLTRVSPTASSSVPLVATLSGAGTYGATLTVSLSSATAGQQFYIQVQGADNTQMGTGRYALGITFDGSTPQLEASPVVQTLVPTIISGGGGYAVGASRINALAALMGFGDSFAVTAPTITGITHDTGVNHYDGVTNARRFAINGFAPAGESVVLYRDGQPIGNCIADSHGQWSYNVRGYGLPDGVYRFTAQAIDPAGELSALSDPFQVTVDTTDPAAPVVVKAELPTIYGTAEPNTTVAIFLTGSDRPVGTTTTDASGAWQFAITSSRVKPNQTRVFAVSIDEAGNFSRCSRTTTLLPPATNTQPTRTGGIAAFAIQSPSHKKRH